MKNFKKCFALFLVVASAVLFLGTGNALAVTPTLSLSSSGDGDSVEVAVTGDANTSVILYYSKSTGGTQINYLGKTSSNGTFSTTLSSAAYGVAAETLVYVTVNGIKSQEVAWPYTSAKAVLSLSKTSLVLSVGSSSTITAYNNGTSALFLSNNTNPSIANINISGNQITIYANNYGSTVVTVCAVSNTSSCASAYVSVQNTGAQPILFSQSSVTVAFNDTVPITIIGGTGTYTLYNNSNSGVILASISGSTANLKGVNASGSAAITICSSDISACGIINAIIGSTSSTGITVSQANPTMTEGQSLSLSLSGASSGSYDVYSNSNSTAVQANISGSTLSLYASKSGSATINICSQNGISCVQVVATVSSTSSGGALSISQNNLWLLVGQSSSLTISGGKMPYSINNLSSIIKTSLSSNILTITGQTAGSVSVDVCSAGGGCVPLAVLVNGSSSSSSTTTFSISKNILNMKVGESSNIVFTGNGSYFMSDNTNQNVASVKINGDIATVSALAVGTTNIALCQSGGTCSTLVVKVTAADSSSTATNTDTWTECASEKGLCSFSGSQTVRYGANGKYNYIIYSDGVQCTNANFGDPIYGVAKTCSYGGSKPAGHINTNTTAASASSSSSSSAAVASKYKFTKTLVYGASGNDVKELQKRLTSEGYYKDKITGKYLTSTVVAVKKYQKAKGIRQTGNMGVQTMAALNK